MDPKRVPVRLKVAGVLSGLAITVALVPGAAYAKAPAPSISWTLPASAVTRLPTPFTWQATALVPLSHLVVERQQGPVWTIVLNLPKRDQGKGDLPGLPAATYTLRLADLSRNGTLYGAAVRTLVVSTPTAKLAFVTDQVNAGSPVSFGYSSTNLPAGASVHLQRQFGTKAVWEDVQAVPGGSGVSTTPGVALGRYDYRIDVKLGHKVVALSNVAPLWSYGAVPLSYLCSEDSNAIAVRYRANGCQGETLQVGTTIFDFVLEDGNGTTAPSYDTLVESAQTSCRSITVQWALDNNAGNGDTASVELVQAAADPQSASTPYGTVGQATFSISSPSWYLDNWVSSRSDVEYINAALSCYSETGLP